MRRVLTLVIIGVVFCFSYVFGGERVNLTKAEKLSVPDAMVLDVAGFEVNFDSGVIAVRYRWVDELGNVIGLEGGRVQVWECDGECYDNAMRYKLKSGDSGYELGLVFRDRIWGEMKGKVLGDGNGGEFERVKVK